MVRLLLVYLMISDQLSCAAFARKPSVKRLRAACKGLYAAAITGDIAAPTTHSSLSETSHLAGPPFGSLRPW